MPRRLLLAAAWALAAGALAAGCDTSPSLDIATPAFAPEAVLRAVLVAGQAPSVRVTVSRDPYGPAADPGRPPATPAGAVVTVWRDGRLVETLAARPQTCHASAESRCDAATGQTVTTTAGAYACGGFGGTVPVEPGARYTVRAEVPGLAPAEATVTVPFATAVAAVEVPGADPARRPLVVTVADVPGPDSRFGLVVLREYDRVATSVCAVGGPRDTTVVLGAPGRYQGRFATTDPLLLATAGGVPDDLPLATFTDATFRDGAATVRLAIDRATSVPSLGVTGALAVQVAVLSPGLFDAYQVAGVELSADNPFAEPANLPSNVSGGLGRVEAVAFADATLPPPP